jgi:elongator complex protein 1
VLTAYACKTPPDLESALSLIGQDLKSGNTSQVEFSIQHLCFLQDVELLYTTSLGLYDLDLTLVVAQHSQKDPKEYLPFLQDLNGQEVLRRKFNIDTHLKRYTKALDHLVEIASSKEEAFNELLDYVVDHRLYQDALRILKHSVDKQNSVLGLYASYLHGKTSYTESAVIYESLGKYEEALDAYELAGDWRQALSIMINNDQFKERKDDMVRRLVGHTMESKEFLDCATIYLDYLNDVPEALRAYCKGFYFGEAIRVAALHSRIDLLEPIIDTGLLEGFSQTSELLSDCKSQIKSQVNRIRELRVKKIDDPLSFFGGNEETDAPDNVSLAPTESSTAPSFFTRYTGKTGGTAQTGATRRTAKNKRREERKRARGKKGSVYEEEYLINSIGRLIERLEITRPEAVRLIEGLVRRGMREHAYQIQKSFVEITLDLSGIVEEVYTMTEKDRERYDDDGKVFYIPLKPVPVITPFPRMQSLDY